MELLPLVSVVLPTRGRPDLVRETLQSIVSQTYAGEIECLVIHDREDRDETLAELSQPRRQIKVLLNCRTPGLPGARNTGLEEAQGQFVASCDDDDVWMAHKLNNQVNLLLEHPELLAVGSGIRLLFPDQIVEWRGRPERATRQHLLRNRVKELHSSTLVMRRDAFAKAGRYDESIPHGYAEDYDFVLRLARVGRIGVVKEPLADIRKNNQSWFRERSANTAEALTYLLEVHPELRADRRGHARVLGQIAFAQAACGERTLALRTMATALRRFPLSLHAWFAGFQAVTRVDPLVLLRSAQSSGRGLS